MRYWPIKSFHFNDRRGWWRLLFSELNAARTFLRKKTKINLLAEALNQKKIKAEKQYCCISVSWRNVLWRSVLVSMQTIVQLRLRKQNDIFSFASSYIQFICFLEHIALHFSSYCVIRNAISDEISAVIADIGSSSCKFGYAGEDTPRHVFNSVRAPRLVNTQTWHIYCDTKMI